MAYKVKVVNNKTIIDKIVVGVPIGSIIESKGDITDLAGVDVTQRKHGSILVYDADRQVWAAQSLAERQIVDGGWY